MAIYNLSRKASFDPDDVERMAAAYESVLKLLRPSDHTNPVKELIAKKVIEVARDGEREPARICTRVLADLGLPPPE